MSERELGDALLRGEHPIDVNELTRRVLRRDRRRMWILGAFCVIAWMLVVMLPWSTVLPMLAKVASHVAAVEQSTAGANASVDRVPTTDATTQRSAQTTELLQIIKQGTIATFIGSIASMFMAAVCTIALILLSRRATLRQVNARLAEISDQLKVLTSRPG